ATFYFTTQPLRPATANQQTSPSQYSPNATDSRTMKLLRLSLPTLFTSILFTSILFTTICGCGPAPQDAPNGPAAPNGTSAQNGRANDESSKVTTELKSWDEFQEWVKSNQGKIVVADVWSTACGECIKEFPNFVAFAKKYDGQVVCGSLNIDFYGSKKETPESGVPRIEERLNKLKAAGIANFISTTADEDVMVEIDSAAIPVSLVYDTEGKLAKSFNNDAGEYGDEGFEYAKDITDYVDSLIAAQKQD
ncbi:MAG: thiol-disulfide isomerase/thioredoxin, partial [Pirellulaceae bacterium]